MRYLSGTTAIIACCLIPLSILSCVYYNTFFNASKAFDEAENTRKESTYGQPRINQAKYNLAIEKSLLVVENHPNSKWYDDALYVLGVSYFYVGQYRNAERRFREILANYQDSKYTKEARLYLAKALLEQKQMTDAMEIFEEILKADVDRKFRAEAAMALGDFNFRNWNYDEAARYYLAVRDTLGSGQEKKVAQRFLADSYFERFQFKEALSGYLQILGMDPDQDEKYHALYQAAVCAYRLQKIDDGLDYLNTLIEDAVYFDSVNVLKLRVAEGYEYDEALEQAEFVYEEVASEATRNDVVAEAYYNLGLIYQFDYDRLDKAKEYYDKAVEAGRSTEFGQDALQRSSDIGKLATFARTIEIDSTTTQAMIDEAAYTQYQLAEVYWFRLVKPDTAILEMQYVVDSFPTSFDAPKAMIALAEMVREHEEDTARADSILHEMLNRYPHSDFVPQALEALDLLGTEADTGYAEKYLQKAEDFLVDEENVDSARAYYQYVVDNFPESNFYLQARFAQIWLTDQYEHPGDSSVYYAYKDFADSFPSTPWASEVQKLINYRSTGGDIRNPRPDDTLGAFADTGQFADSGFVATEEGDTTGYIDPQRALYIDPNGETALSIPSGVKVLEDRFPFEYPTEAIADRWEGELYFQIKLDFSGAVIDLIQKTWSDIDEINIRAEEHVEGLVFDTRLIPPEYADSWFVYKLRIFVPDQYR